MRLPDWIIRLTRLTGGLVPFGTPSLAEVLLGVVGRYLAGLQRMGRRIYFCISISFVCVASLLNASAQTLIPPSLEQLQMLRNRDTMKAVVFDRMKQ